MEAARAAVAAVQTLRDRATALQGELATSGDVAKRGLVERVRELAMSMSMPVPAHLDDPMGVLERIQAQLRETPPPTVDGSWDTAEELLRNVSGGQALCGVCINPDITKLPQPARAPVLEWPRDGCALLGPDLPESTTEHKFSSARMSDDFSSVLNVGGKTFAASVAAEWPGGSVTAGVAGGHHHELAEARHVVRRSASASVTTQCFYPLMAFRFVESSMRLTQAALADLRRVDDEATARQWLARFGSHVPVGLQHLGGMYLYTCKIETGEEMETSSLQEAASTYLNTAAAATGGFLVARAAVAVRVSSGSAHAGAGRATAADKMASACCSTTSFGPTSPSPSIFRLALIGSNKQWRIIDRGSYPADFVPIWDLIVRGHPEFADAATRLSETHSRDREIAAAQLREAAESRAAAKKRAAAEQRAAAERRLTDERLAAEELRMYVPLNVLDADGPHRFKVSTDGPGAGWSLVSRFRGLRNERYDAVRFNIMDAPHPHRFKVCRRVCQHVTTYTLMSVMLRSDNDP